LGGDLCELIPLNETRTLLAIGDASGDSVPAAMVMSAVRGAMRALSSADASEENPTEKMMAQINHTLHQITPPHQFMSLLIGIFDREKITFLYTNAGHPAPIVVRGKETFTLDSHGMLLGVLDKSEYTHSLLQLENEDILIAFSDGISEAMSDRKSMFHQDGIAASIMPPGDRTAYELLQAIWSKMELHIKGSNNGDDRTLLVLRMPS
jgi:sigma-B regulation protein RsbU (phosphoserine phosphatase)